MKTIRQQIFELLQVDVLGARELSQQLGITEREVYDHLTHIQLSVKSIGKKFCIDPPVCLDCNFVFKDRKKITKPGHCPLCKNSHIQRPLYAIK